jgi:hypothetical protein
MPIPDPTAQHKFSSDDDIVIEIAGCGDDARRIARMGDWTLTAFVGRGDDEPRMSIADIAARAGQQACELRRTARGIKSEKFNPITAWVAPMPGHHSGFRELFLNEAETLFLLTRLRTPAAQAITWDMIRVYMLARRGLLPQPHDEITHTLLRVVEQQGAMLAGIVKRLDTMETRRAADDGLIGRDRARRVLDTVIEIANICGTRADDPRAWGKRRSKIETDVRKAARLPMSRRIEDLDASRLGDAWLRLGELRRDAAREAEDRAATRRALQQRTLFDALPPDIQALAKLS